MERHQTLRSTVEWSYQLLDADDRAVFDRLGVFAGTFDTAGASAVTSDDDLDSWRIVDSIASLVAKSMLVVEDGPDDTTRYAMLETLRQFARERLEEAGVADHWRRRHAKYYATFTETAGAGLRGPDEVAWMARLVAEFDNLRAAVEWGLDRDDLAERELSVRIVASFSFTTMGLATVNALGGIGLRGSTTVPRGVAIARPRVGCVLRDAPRQRGTCTRTGRRRTPRRTRGGSYEPLHRLPSTQLHRNGHRQR